MGYPKIFRIPVPQFPVARGKHYLSEAEVNELLDGIVVMEEKIDGKIDGVVVSGKTIFYEFMKYRHTIAYNKLPSFRMGFDVWDGQKFLSFHEKEKFLKNIGFSMIRKIFFGKTNYQDLLAYLSKLLALQSAYGDEVIEGILIKNYERQLFAKIVNPQFEESIDASGHWSKKPVVLNRLSTGGAA